MTLAQLSDYHGLLICPRCLAALVVAGDGTRCSRDGCRYAAEPFLVIDGIPVLIDFEHSIVNPDELVASRGSAQIRRDPPTSALMRWLLALVEPRNRVAERSVERMLAALRTEGGRARKPLVVVVGGGEIGSGIEALYDADDVDVLGFDIYRSEVVQLIADAHRVPVADGSVDGVVVQAVLEHVLEPHLVAGEIHRVLRPEGLVYADTPFLWPVHEGPYDFTRFTDSGHRFLFRDFEVVDSGVVGGAGTQLALSLESFVRALFRSRLATALARLAFAWLPRLDRFVDPQRSVDGAASVYLLGRKTSTALAPNEIVPYYQGAQRST